MERYVKIEVLDLIIETLAEHEKALDDVVHRLEALLPQKPRVNR